MTLWLGAQSFVLALWGAMSILIAIDLLRRARQAPGAFASFRADPATRTRRWAWLALSGLLVMFAVVAALWLATGP